MLLKFKILRKLFNKNNIKKFTFFLEKDLHGCQTFDSCPVIDKIYRTLAYYLDMSFFQHLIQIEQRAYHQHLFFTIFKMWFWVYFYILDLVVAELLLTFALHFLPFYSYCLFLNLKVNLFMNSISKSLKLAVFILKLLFFKSESLAEVSIACKNILLVVSLDVCSMTLEYWNSHQQSEIFYLIKTFQF